MNRFALLLIAFALPVVAQTADHAKDGRGLVETVEYDIRPLLYKPGSARTGYDSVEQIVREITAAVEPGGWGKPAREIGEKNGTHLVVTTSADRHAEIKTLLQVLTDRTDLAVDVSGTVYEIDRKVFEGELLPKLDKGELAVGGDGWAKLGRAELPHLPKPEARRPEACKPVMVSDGWAKLVAESGKKTLDGTARIPTGRGATVASRRNAIEDGGGGKSGELEFVGTSIAVSVRVPRQRRSVFITVTETTRELVSSKDTPRVSEVVMKSDAGEVPDGAAVAVLLSGGGKDAVWVLILRPGIFIQAEEDAIKKAETERK